MAKRFTDSDKWKKAWFRRLRPVHKCFWSYVLDNCNNAGIWEVDFEAASFNVGEELNALEVMRAFQKQYYPYALGKRWFIVDFVDFQYGDLRPTNNLHVSVISTLKKHALYDVYLAKKEAEKHLLHEKQSVSGDHKGDQEKEEDKDKEKEEEKDLNSPRASDVPKESIAATKLTLLKNDFDEVRKAFPGIRRGLEVEWDNLRKKNNPADVIPLMIPAIERGKAYRSGCAAVKAFCADWPHFSTWVNQSRWTEEYGAIPAPRGSGFNPPAASRDQLQATMDAVLGQAKGIEA